MQIECTETNRVVNMQVVQDSMKKLFQDLFQSWNSYGEFKRVLLSDELYASTLKELLDVNDRGLKRADCAAVSKVFEYFSVCST